MKNSIEKILLPLLFMLIILSATPSSAQTDEAVSESPINFAVSVSNDTLTIGDDFKVVVKADYPEELKLSQPSGKAVAGAFALKAEPEIKFSKKNGRIYEEYTFTLAVFETGELEIPSFEFFWYDQEGHQNIANSPIKNIYVESVLPVDTAGLDIKDIIGPKPLPVRWYPYVIAALAILAVAAVTYYLYRRKMKAVAVPQAPPEPPYDRAIRELALLKTKDLPGKGKIKQYYIELSDIIRHYIQGRFNIIAVEATTYELKRSLRHPDLSRDKTEAALKFLNRTDMVKFAKHIPETKLYDEDYDLVRDFVVSTKPYERPVEQAEVVA
jgi:hypothetical protein